jgi:ribosomal protein S18 acetylase RimI-like enzyme
VNENNRITAADVRACMRGDVYGEAETMTDAWFADHVARNDIDLAVSPRWTVDGELVAFALLAFREDRAWIGGFGVAPPSRGAGMGGVCVADTLRIVREAGATAVELEVLEHNLAAITLYEHGGFEQVGELVAWRRERRSVPRTGADGTISTSPRDAAGVAATARRPSTCWQREPRSVAAAAPFVTLTIGDEWNPAAYAFVRIGGPRGDVLLDAGARDDSAAHALVDALDARFAAQDLSLINEPPSGPLDDALSSNPFWDPMARQRRMRAQLR